MHFLKVFVTFVCSVAGAASIAESLPPKEDLENCLYKTGFKMEPSVCEERRWSDQRNRENQKRRAERNEELKREFEEQMAASKAKELEAKNERERISAEINAKRKAEQEAYWKQDAADRSKYEREERAYEKKQAGIVNAKKQVCGEDYAAPKIGMTIARAQQCVAKFKLVSQLNRADGVISMYSGGGIYLHVMNGSVVAWTR